MISGWSGTSEPTLMISNKFNSYMYLTVREGYWITLGMNLIAVITLISFMAHVVLIGKILGSFHRPDFFILQMRLMSRWIFDRNISCLASISSA
jgi:hypothetical protein